VSLALRLVGILLLISWTTLSQAAATAVSAAPAGFAVPSTASASVVRGATSKLASHGSEAAIQPKVVRPGKSLSTMLGISRDQRPASISR